MRALCQRCRVPYHLLQIDTTSFVEFSFEHASSFNFLELEKKIIPRELTVGISFFGVGSVYKGVAIVRDE